MLRKYLVAGLLIWLPLAITLWVIDFIVTTMDRTLTVLPPSWHPDQVLGMHLPGLGLIMSVIILLVTGVLAANIIGPGCSPGGNRCSCRFPSFGRSTRASSRCPTRCSRPRGSRSARPS